VDRGVVRARRGERRKERGDEPWDRPPSEASAHPVT
jgi:hypothetical protein